MQPRVWQHELGSLDHPIVVEQEVEVDGSGRVRPGADAPELAFNSEEKVEEIVWAAAGLDADRGIQVIARAGRAIDRCGFVDL